MPDSGGNLSVFHTSATSHSLSKVDNIFCYGRKSKGGILTIPSSKKQIVNIRPPKWVDNTFWISADNYPDAQYIADAVYYHVGHGPIHFCDANFQYPPLRLATRELLTREACSAYVRSIAKGPAMKKQREDYRARVKELVLKAIKGPEAVLFLRSLRPVARLETNFEATEESETFDDSAEAVSHFVDLLAQEDAGNDVGDELTGQGNSVESDNLRELQLLTPHWTNVVPETVDPTCGFSTLREQKSKSSMSETKMNRFLTPWTAPETAVNTGDESEEQSRVERASNSNTTDISFIDALEIQVQSTRSKDEIITEIITEMLVPKTSYTSTYLGNATQADISGFISRNPTTAMSKSNTRSQQTSQPMYKCEWKRGPDRTGPPGDTLLTNGLNWKLNLWHPTTSSKVFFGDFRTPTEAARAADSAFHHYCKSHLLINIADTPQILSQTPTTGITDDLKFCQRLESLAIKLLSTSCTSPSTREHDALASVNSPEIPESSRDCTAVTLGFDSFSQIPLPSTFGGTDQHLGGVEPSLHLSLKSSDVFRFAMVCNEIMTGKPPFSGIEDSEPMKQIEAGVRPELSGEMDEGYISAKLIDFNLHASHAKEGPENYLAKAVMGASGGLPLALKVIGSSMFDKRLDGNREQSEAIDALRERTDVMGSDDIKFSLRVVGTGFWRAPEIFLAGKTRDTGIYRLPELIPSLVKTAGRSKEDVDVYSFDVTCFEILTRRLLSVGSVGLGSIGTTLYNNVGLWRNVKHMHEEDIKESDRDATSNLHKWRGYRRRKVFPLVDDVDMGAESNLEACASISLVPSADLYMGPEMPESIFGVKLSILSDEEPSRKRIRTRNWCAEEICTMLELMEEALRVDKGRAMIWEYVSENLWDQYGFDRASNSCKNLWFSLLRSYRAVRDHVSKFRAFAKFDLECGEKIERLLNAKPFEDGRNIQMDHAGLPSCTLPFCRFQSSASDISHQPTDSANYYEVLSDELADSEMDDLGSDNENDGLSCDSTATLESQAGFTVGSHVPSCFETNSTCAGRKRSAATAMEDDLISRIAPFVTKQIEDALKPLLSALRSQEEDEQKHREKLLAIEERKLALKREKMLLTHRVLANSNPF